MHFKWIITTLFLFCLHSINGQNEAFIMLKIDSKELKRINYKEKHNSSESIEITGNRVLQLAYNEGYLTAYFDTLSQKKNFLHLKLITPRKYAIGNINIPDSLVETLRPSLKEKHISNQLMTPDNLVEIHKSVINYYENNGYPFVSSKFINIQIDSNVFNADLFIQRGPQIVYDTLIIKGDGKINHGILSYYLNVKKGKPYSEKDLSRISEKIKNMNFINEIRSHEIIFKEGKAAVYVYIEKGKSSNANGIVGIQPNNQTGKINVTGDVQLKLQNVFKIAETIKVKWQKLQPQTQDLEVFINFPLLFKTPFGIEGAFNLYKRDTSFLDLIGRAGLFYTLSNFNSIGIFYKYEDSKILNTITNPNSLGLTPVTKNHFGINLHFQRFDNFRNPTRGYEVNSDISFVNRSITEFEQDTIAIVSKNNAYEISIEAQTFIPLGKRHTIKIRGQGFYQIAPRLYRNELFRIGGLNTLRGFDEESINVSSAAIGTIEYRFLLDQFSNIFAFFDIAGYESNSIEKYVKDYPFGFGAGINFSTKFGTFSLTYALGHQMDNPIKFQSSKVHFGYINNF